MTHLSRILITSIGLLACLPTVHANIYKWDADGDGSIGSPATVTSGSGTWDTTSTLWNVSGTTDVAWVNGNTARFGSTSAADGFFTIIVDSSVTTLAASSGDSLLFQANEFTLTATSSRTITANGAVAVNSGVTAILDNNIHLTSVTSASSSGRLILNGGSSISSNGTSDFHIGNMEIKSGSSLTIDGRVLVNGGSSQSLLVNGAMDFGGATLFLGQGTNNDMTATLSGTGTITATSSTSSTGYLQIGSSGGSTVSRGTFNLDGGTLTIAQVREGGSSGTTSTFNFNGGILKARTGTGFGTTFMQGLDTANVRNGGAIFDTNGVNITVGQALIHSSIDGDNAIDGGLTKRGSGTLTLTAVNTFTGDISIEAGTLSLASAFINDNADVILLTGAVLNLNYTGTDSIGRLFIDGLAQDAGIYGAVGSGADHERAFITGAGWLNVTSGLIPEPTTAAALTGLAALGLGTLRRRRC